MANKTRTSHTKRRVLAALLLASLATSLMGPAAVAPLRRLARWALAPAGGKLMGVATSLVAEAPKTDAPAISLDQAEVLRNENRYLRHAVRELLHQLDRKDEHLAEIQQLRSRFYGPSRDMPAEFVPAQVVAGDALPYSLTRVLNVGSGRGARRGMPVATRVLLLDRQTALPKKLAVVGASALVGRLVDTDAYTARMRLVTDPRFELAVLIRRVVDPAKPRLITVSREGGTAEEILTWDHPDVEARAQGTGEGLIIEHVKALHRVQPGDLVLTRPTDGLIGASLPVGEVTEVRDDPAQRGLFVNLIVAPRAHLPSLRDVYILVPPPLSTEPDAEGRP